jgi:hypothetical protein
MFLPASGQVFLFVRGKPNVIENDARSRGARHQLRSAPSSIRRQARTRDS